MPSVPLYLHRLNAGIAALEAAPGDLVDRRAVEEALGVGKWTAWRIMKRCGAFDGPGQALVCHRSELVERLRGLQTDRRFAPEIARRERVERYLDGMVRYASRKHTEVARDLQAEVLLGTRFAKLPPGIDLTPSELHIRFDGSEDFLRKIGAVIFALNNDLETIQEYIESRTR